MKRRNADCGKIRRPIKRNKIAEGMYGSNTILYMKFLILWAIVITADFMFMFRFEFLWPFWLLLRSVHDSFKYKGLAFSVLFVCIAITSDLVCLFFIPVHWLLFAASTYVWVQYVWHTDKGICLPTIILWMLFVYLEAAIRWKDSRHLPHLDLCRPFAAHCIGYPVVTLGFGFKSYVGYRMRQRKQREVAKENEFYMQLLQQALPQDETATVDEHQQSLIPNNSSTTVLTGNGSLAAQANPVAQTVQTNSLDNPHHNLQQNSSPNFEEKSSLLTNGGGGLSSPPNTNQTTQNSSIHQFSSNNHHNSTTFNSSSSNNYSKNAQSSNSRLNNVSQVSSSSNASGSSTANGHVSNSMNGVISHKNNRRSADKDRNDLSQNSSYNSSSRGQGNSSAGSNQDGYSVSGSNNTLSTTSKLGSSFMSHLTQLTNHVQRELNFGRDKEKDNSENATSASSPTSPITTTSASSSSNNNNTTSSGGKESGHQQQTNGHHDTTNNNSGKKNYQNGNVLQYEIEEIADPPEKAKGKRNRSKRDNASSKDNHSNSSTTSQAHHTNTASTANNKELNATDSSNTSSTTSISTVTSHIVTKVCEACLRLEAEIKKYRAEVSQMKQIENELRQKHDSHQNMKTCLQAKQRENDELEKRLNELQTARQSDFTNISNMERRLNEERRQRQSSEAQLNNEKKARKVAEDKASRPECSESCKQRKMQIESETKQLRRELKVVEDAKQVAEQQTRKYEQELRMFEAEVRNRDAQQGTEVLMSALTAMQDKNSTLEKNLSAETRVKLDLFSALGEAKRQLEIKDSMIRNKDDEVLDLKAKIAQLLAVMPTDSLCLPPCSTTGSSMLRMNDTPPLQGPSSPMMVLSQSHQQMLAAAHQMNSRNVPLSVGVITSSSGVNCGANSSNVNNMNSNVNQASNLDPNATAYTPKNPSMVGGAEA